MWLANDLAAYRIAQLHAEATDRHRARIARAARAPRPTHRHRPTLVARVRARLTSQPEIDCRRAAGRAIGGAA